MNGYVIESLCPTGWRRSNLIQFRYRDALEQATNSLSQGLTRAVRILPVSIIEQPVFQQERKPCQQSSGGNS